MQESGWERAIPWGGGGGGDSESEWLYVRTENLFMDGYFGIVHFS